jgi:hypothetical protein
LNAGQLCPEDAEYAAPSLEPGIGRLSQRSKAGAEQRSRLRNVAREHHGIGFNTDMIANEALKNFEDLLNPNGGEMAITRKWGGNSLSATR